MKCPLRCVNGKVYGYGCPHPGHYGRPSEVALQRLSAEWDREVGTVGAVLTIEDIRRAAEEMRKALEEY